MSNKKFASPFVILGGLIIDDEGDDEYEGGGTGQSSTTPYPCSFEDWKIMFPVDYDDNGYDFNDYHTWFFNCNFSQEDWERFNPEDGNLVEFFPDI